MQLYGLYVLPFEYKIVWNIFNCLWFLSDVFFNRSAINCLLFPHKIDHTLQRSWLFPFLEPTIFTHVEQNRKSGPDVTTPSFIAADCSWVENDNFNWQHKELGWVLGNWKTLIGTVQDEMGCQETKSGADGDFISGKVCSGKTFLRCSSNSSLSPLDAAVAPGSGWKAGSILLQCIRSSAVLENTLVQCLRQNLSGPVPAGQPDIWHKLCQVFVAQTLGRFQSFPHSVKRCWSTPILIIGTHLQYSPTWWEQQY